jgi:alkylhydroperoxidase family enzyme
MAWIRMIDEEAAQHPLRELYDQMIDPDTGRVDEILRIHSLHPAGLLSHFTLYRTVMASTSGLRKAEREMIALVVSCLNNCHY